MMYPYPISDKIQRLKQQMLSESRYVSIEQAQIITRVYKENKDEPIIKKRALALTAALETLAIDLR